MGVRPPLALMSTGRIPIVKIISEPEEVGDSSLDFSQRSVKDWRRPSPSLNPHTLYPSFDGIEVSPRRSALKLADLAGTSVSSFEVEQEAGHMMHLTRSERKSVLQELKRSGIFSHASVSPQRRARALLLSAWWQVVLSALAIIDVACLVREIISGSWLQCRPKRWSTSLCGVGFYVEVAVALAFAADVASRVGAMGWMKFKRRYVCLWDLLVAAGCVVSLVSFFAIRMLKILVELQHVDLLSIQAWRLLRIGRLFWMCPFVRGFRYIVSENRRRFIDFMEDFDLDLTYVTPRVIAMGLPTDKCLLGCCRNRLSDVARFLDSRHPGRYLIVNCCPELPYNCAAFKTGSVLEFDIQDHAPPKMSQFVEFIIAVQRWMHQDPMNVLAVHCKAGKGRTGCMVASWLLYSRLCAEIEDALAIYALARTDISASGRLQGVETPSQVRYLRHFEQLLNHQTAYVNVLPRPPPEPAICLQALFFERVWAAPPPASMRVAVHGTQGGRSVVLYWSTDFHATDIEVPLPCSIAGDVRVSIFDAKALDQERSLQSRRQRQPCNTLAPAFLGDVLAPNSAGSETTGTNAKRFIAGKEPGCLFFFLFHTAFLESSGELRVRIGATDEDPGMDKAFKKAKTYNMDGHVALRYSAADVEIQW